MRKQCKAQMQMNRLMNREIEAHCVSGIWELVLRPIKNKKNIIIKGLWYYKVKIQHGKVTSFKSRYCTDSSHVNNFPENIYALTTLLTSINFMLLMLALYKIPIKSSDISNAYV